MPVPLLRRKLECNYWTEYCQTHDFVMVMTQVLIKMTTCSSCCSGWHLLLVIRLVCFLWTWVPIEDICRPLYRQRKPDCVWTQLPLRHAWDNRQPILLFAVSAGLDLGILSRQIQECLTMGCIAHMNHWFIILYVIDTAWMCMTTASA